MIDFGLELMIVIQLYVFKNINYIALCAQSYSKDVYS